ncbi:MAG: LacI family DNA-binding transcriptional regulator, partial [Chloroflexales bacterium]|nr:LacI family DNA-binding transcriptional regulator [Chloroflexales bacterium]
MGQTTQEDVARLAGVSRATVSYVLNNQSGGKVRISDETRQRVQDAIRQLGYQPDAAARTLRTGRTQLLAVMVPDLTNPFYPLLIRGAQRLAEEGGYELLVYDTNDRADRESTFVDMVLRRRVDGVILVAFHLPDGDVARLRAANIQIAAVGGRLRNSGVDAIVTPERIAVAEAIAHLVERGHRRIAHLAGPQDTPPGRARLRGYHTGLANAAIPADEGLIRYGSFGGEGVNEMIDALFAATGAAAPSALFAA